MEMTLLRTLEPRLDCDNSEVDVEGKQYHEWETVPLVMGEAWKPFR